MSPNLSARSTLLALIPALSACSGEVAPACPPPTTVTAPCPPPPPPPLPSASASTSTSADAGCPEDENPWCQPGEPNYGAWKATPKEINAAAHKLGGFCATPGWIAQAVEDCQARLGQASVKVLAGVMSGEHATTNACVVSVGSATFNERHFITFRADIREVSTFFGYTSAVEMKKSGPVLVTYLCQGSPTASTGPGGPRPKLPDWSSFPKDLQERLCQP